MIYYNLELPINPLSKSISFHDLPNQPWSLYSIENLNQELINFLYGIGICITTAAVFTTIGKQETTIHIDGLKIGNFAKLNFVKSTGLHQMNWYLLKEETKLVPSLRPSENNLPERNYVNFLPKDVELIETTVIGYPGLVNVGVPHNITNINGIRKCLSLGILDKTGMPLTVEKAVDLFSNYL